MSVCCHIFAGNFTAYGVNNYLQLGVKTENTTLPVIHVIYSEYLVINKLNMDGANFY